MNKRKKNKRILLMVPLFLSLALGNLGLAGAEGPVVGEGQETLMEELLTTGSGVMKKAKFLDETGQISTDNLTWKDAFNTTVQLTGTAPQCIELRYSGEVALTGSPDGDISGQFRALVDGVVANGDSPYVSPDSNVVGRYETEGMNWWRCNLASGGMVHTVKIQFKAAEATTMYVRNRTLAIEFKAGN